MLLLLKQDCHDMYATYKLSKIITGYNASGSAQTCDLSSVHAHPLAGDHAETCDGKHTIHVSDTVCFRLS